MKWFVVREADNVAHVFFHDIEAKAFAALQARQHPEHSYYVCASITQVKFQDSGVVHRTEAGIIRDGTGDYRVCMPPPLSASTRDKIIKAQHSRDEKLFVDLMKPGSSVSEEARLKSRVNEVIHPSQVVSEPDVEDIAMGLS